jgi:hypothetical protein
MFEVCTAFMKSSRGEHVMENAGVSELVTSF